MRYQQWLMYLRKSRQDDPSETIEEVLSKHETILQEYAERELGGKIPPENIYREVKSGESIAERGEMQKVLARIEDPAILGVLVVDPQRLGRLDLKECGALIDAFRFSRTQVGTPLMVYDLNNKMERRFFQDDLLRGRDYLEYVKETLYRGRVAAVKRGCYIMGRAPYGYNKIKIGKDNTLEPNDKADLVRMIFEWYGRQDKTTLQIADELNALEVAPPQGKAWCKETIWFMLGNIHYIGKVYYGGRRYIQTLEDGKIVKKRLKQPESEVVVAEGKHPAIIDNALWEIVQARRATLALPIRKGRQPINPLAGVLLCGRCGRPLRWQPYPRTGEEPRYTCAQKRQCTRSARVSEVMDALLFALEKTEIPELEVKIANGDGDAVEIQKRLIAKLEKQMEEYRAQEETQFELLETKKYTQELFDRRNAALREKMDACQKQLYQAKSTLPENVDYSERVATLREAIAKLKDPNADVGAVNRFIKTIIDKIEYHNEPAAGKRGKNYTENKFTLEVFLKL